jgi:hypothetical protein
MRRAADFFEVCLRVFAGEGAGGNGGQTRGGRSVSEKLTAAEFMGHEKLSSSA